MKTLGRSRSAGRATASTGPRARVSAIHGLSALRCRNLDALQRMDRVNRGKSTLLYPSSPVRNDPWVIVSVYAWGDFTMARIAENSEMGQPECIPEGISEKLAPLEPALGIGEVMLE